jgi:hypothetical protein
LKLVPPQTVSHFRNCSLNSNMISNSTLCSIAAIASRFVRPSPLSLLVSIHFGVLIPRHIYHTHNLQSSTLHNITTHRGSKESPMQIADLARNGCCVNKQSDRRRRVR